MGCQALVPDLPASYGPPHTYLGTSPGCWQIYTELTARIVPDMTVRGLLADTYMVQHPGVSSRQAIQSVVRHLMGLCCVLEMNLSFERAVVVMKKAPVAEFTWLEPPTFLGPLTVVDLARAFEETIQPDLVREWALTTWQAWGIYHGVVRSWVEKALV
ncbi:MAG: hypothetical protein BGO39_22015 [Chloroflexi bacterium 54-19]|nr:MAG: hypothetical protein BGO39_22015 [Chloroflexi bacterium 54-19]